MRRFVAASAIAAFGFAGSGYAAGLPAKAPAYKAPPPVAVSTWTGFYVGGHLGGAWETQGSAAASDPIITIPFAPVSTSLNASSFLGGGQVGYNFQFNSKWVAGIEGDASWTRLHAGANPGVFLPPAFGGGPLANSVVQFGSNVDWLASLRGRLGYAWNNNWLLYATGGVAWADFKYSANLICPGTTCLPPPSGLVAPGSGSSTDTTWVAGAGLQWKPTSQNWSVGVEYLYYGFDSTHNFPGAERNAATGALVSFGGCARATPCNLQYSVRDSAIQVARIRFDWKFGP
jgi:outer membrane immunogenic protein